MPMSNDVLFRPFRCKNLTLANRVVMAPMTRGFCQNGVPDAEVASYYERRAKGGVGLILSEGVLIERPAAGNQPHVPRAYGDAALAGWRDVINRVHAAGGKMGLQLWHVGATPDPRMHWRAPSPPESPSGIYTADKANGQAMTDADIADTIDAYGRAAMAVQSLGFDCVEIHGAHGYLIDQFFWEQTNRRTDKFGGSTLAQRTAFATAVIKSIRSAVGWDFPVLMRLSQWKQFDYAARLASAPRELEAWLAPLAEAGVDIFHGSQRRFWEAEFPEIDGENGLNFAGWIKKLTGRPAISVGSVGVETMTTAHQLTSAAPSTDLTPLVERLAREEFDLIAVGRALLTDAAWLSKIRSGATHDLLGVQVDAFGRLT